MTISLGGYDDGTLFKDLPAGLGGLGVMRKQLKSPMLEISFSVGHDRDKFLDSDAAKEAAGMFVERVGSTHSDVKSVTIAGETKFGACDEIDLIKERLHVVTDIPLSRKRQLEYSHRIAAVLNAMTAKAGKIKKACN